ncbi:MAG TPA: efflux RND transporter periplasmic adaptor subunit, partial [Myxococcota bacterium]|nr:efflux RND transporter periplasmic adaptor subunit [Myxococcota bacterium]
AVSATPVLQGDVPVYLMGLGSVAAFYTVQVRSQVDGRVDRVLFREGQEVRRGDLLAQIDPRPYEIGLHQAQAALARDVAQLKNARLGLDRNKTLRERNLVAQQALDDAQSLVDQLEGVVLADQAQVDNANLQLTYTRITAPIDGRTGVRLIDPGNLVRAGDANGIVIIAQMDPIAVLFTLPEDHLPEVMDEMSRRELEVEALGRDGKVSYGRGTVTLVDNQINATTGTMRLKAVLANPRRVLWPNQFVKVRLHLRTLAGALTVPAAVVQRGPQGTFAYIIDADGRAAVRALEVLTIVGETAVIAAGLSAGERVVVEGQYQLRPGSPVTVAPDATAADH